MKLDLLLTGANIVTLAPQRPHARAIGMWRGRIVGLDEEVTSLDSAETYDLHGATVVPGFIDAHTHLQLTGQSMQALSIAGIRDVQQALQKIAGYASSRPDDAWIEISGYDQRTLGRDLTAAELDRAVGTRRAWARHISSHSSVVSTSVIEKITDADLRQKATRQQGWLGDRDQDAVFGQRLPYSFSELGQAVGRAADAASSDGVTFCIEAGAGGEIGSLNSLDLQTFDRLQRAGKMPVRLQIMPSYDALHPVDGGRWDGFEYGLDLGLMEGMGSDLLSIGALKFVLDGGMMVRTSLLTEPYAGTDERGSLRGEPRMFVERMGDAIAAGWKLAVHAIGDAAVDVALDGFEHAFAKTPAARGRHRIEHAGLIRPDQIARIAAQQLAVANQFCFLWDSGDDFAELIGPQRVPWLYRGRSLLDAGIPLIGSTDRPLPGSPLRGIQTAVQRRSASGAELSLDESITRQEALSSWTTTAAWAAGMGDRLGALVPGYLADLTVLAEDPLEVDVDEISDIPVRGTVVNGTVVQQL